MKLTMLGAAKQVSGSMSLLETESLKILIDCGLVQTNDTKKDIIENMKPFNFDPSEIDYVVITHSHIDHCGLIPYLVKRGYTGPILCTEPTMNICSIALVDCAYIWQKELERSLKCKDGKYKTNNTQTLYTIEDAEYAMQFFRGYGFNNEIILDDNVTLTFRNAGHILGAASLEFSVKDKDGYKQKKVIFSGDISGKNDFHPFVKPVEYIDKADYLICESTYGNRKHEKTPVVNTLETIIKDTCIQNRKTILIASFSVQRLQELIWYLYKTYEKNPAFQNIPIYIDTPMGIKVTREVYAKSKEFYNDEALELYDKIGNIFEWDKLEYVNGYKESMALATSVPKIIVASAGMMQAGRIINHIESFLPSKGCTIVLTGFCAIGTFGRKLSDAMENEHKTIQSLSGKKLTIRSNVIKIDGLSGHSDKSDLLKYIGNIKGLKKVILNHGEKESLNILKSELQLKTDTEILIPNKNTSIILK